MNRSLLLFLVSMMVFVSCDREPRISDPARFTQYIESHTAGVISRRSVIAVEFADQPLKVDISEEVDEDLLTLDPPVQGELRWEGPNRLVFEPGSDLEPGKEYSVTVLLKDLFEVEEDQRKFTFTIQVLEQAYSVGSLTIGSVDQEQLKWNRLDGELISADIADEAELTQLLKASQDGRDLTIRWLVGPDGLHHRFLVDSIQREKEVGLVDFRWKDDMEGAPSQMEIPSILDFSIVQVLPQDGSGQSLLVNFSDPLRRDQNLEGLVYFKGQPSPKLEIRGNSILVYPSTRISGQAELRVSKGVQNIAGAHLKESDKRMVTFSDLSPSVRFLRAGNILPDEGHVHLPIEVVNLKALDVRVIRIYKQNVGHYFQDNQYGENDRMRYLGRPIVEKTIPVQPEGGLKPNTWQTIAVDLTELWQAEPGAMYSVRLGFKPSYSLYQCPGVSMEEDPEYPSDDWDGPGWSEEYNYGIEGYTWKERNNPCHVSYFNFDRFPTKNVFVTDLGLTIRGGEGQDLQVITTNLRTAQPEAGVSVTFYNFQNAPVGASLTGKDGTATFRTQEVPYLAVARKGDHTTYLRIDPGSSLNLSAFDTYGKTVKAGLKAFMYGERGVWRPGDTIHLSAFIEDAHDRIPEGHPLILELQDPTGKVIRKQVKKYDGHSLVSFPIPTYPEDKTGFYVARLKVGSSEFTERLRLETIKPNRMKIELGFDSPILSSGSESIDLVARWLTGMKAGAYKATVEMDLASDRGGFETFPGYVFYDETKRFDWRSNVVFDGKLGDQGSRRIEVKIDEYPNSPGLLKAGFNVKVFEPGGDFSIYREIVPLAPFTSLVGFSPPKTDVQQPWLTSGETYRIPVVRVNGKGEKIKGGKIHAEVFRIDWRWWWSSQNGRNVSFMNNQYSNRITDEMVPLSDGRGIFSLKIPSDKWGRYYVRFTDESSGHSTGGFLYFDWPMGRDRSGREGQEGVTELVFASEKESYKVGENVTLKIPTTEKGRLLICLDKGSGPYKHLWVDATKGMTEVTFPAEAGMAPTLYAYVMQLQPYEQTSNDLPLRLYGVIPIGIENSDSRLVPRLTTQDKYKPNSKYSVKVSEEKGRPMSYTLAIVDEGLLDLTRFKTPQPWDHFYGRESYTVMTWDMFDEVMGAFGGKIDQLLSVGGDEDLDASKAKNNLRFKPVVQFTGPHHLEKNEDRTHSFEMPNYVGSVRVMLIAGEGGRYGHTEKTVPVTQPLMTLATLPRVAGLGERIVLPVTVFRMEEEGPDEVTVMLELDNISSAERQKTLKTPERGTYTVNFELTSPMEEGVAQIKVTTKGGGNTSFDKITLPIRNPIPLKKVATDVVIPSGESGSITLENENEKVLNWNAEWTSIPFISPVVIMDFLNDYPYGCTEQRLSRMMGQVVSSTVYGVEQGDIRKRMADMNRYLQSVQGSEGGFRLWAGQTFPDGWVTSMAGHYMMLASKSGVPYPSSRKSAWLGYQQRRAREWSMPNQYNPHGDSPAEQAYRLYTLVLHDHPEVGAMNRLRLQTSLDATTLALLGAAYAKMGQSGVAAELKTRWSKAPTPKNYYRYESASRNNLIMSYVSALLGDRESSYNFLRLSAERFNSPYSFNTQEGLWALLAIQQYLGEGTVEDVNGTWSAGGKPLKDGTGTIWTAKGSDPETSSVIKARNSSNIPLNLKVVRTIRSLPGDESPYSRDLDLSVTYLNLRGEIVDPAQMKQGEEVRMVVKVKRTRNIAMHDLALRVRIPSGWEIRNERMAGDQDASSREVIYQDFRDDHIDVFFDLDNSNTHIFEYRFTATYAGRFYLPPVRVEAMYEPGIEAQNKGQWVTVSGED